ncbi:primase/helicase [Choristoneura biennis entomopoxvirus 'L' virophage]|nr:primase/helicase [Choristoneura biennis entomopoxvirus 'L' virophage]
MDIEIIRYHNTVRTEKKIIQEEDLKKKCILGYELYINKNIKAHFDIEIYTEHDESFDIYMIILTLTDKHSNDCDIYTASRHSIKNNLFKNSFHVVLNDRWLHCGKCIEQLANEIFKNSTIKIDTSIYVKRSSEKIFRLPYTNKYPIKDSRYDEDDKFLLIDRKRTIEDGDNLILFYDIPKDYNIYIKFYISYNSNKVKLEQLCYNADSSTSVINNMIMSKSCNKKCKIPKNKLLKTLNKIPKNTIDDYKKSLEIIWAIKHVCDQNGYGTDGLDISHLIMSKGCKYDKIFVDKTYNEYKEQDKPLSYNSLCKLADIDTNDNVITTVSFKINNSINTTDPKLLYSNNDICENNNIYEILKSPYKGYILLKYNSNLAFAHLYFINNQIKNKKYRIYDLSNIEQDLIQFLIVFEEEIFNNINDMKKYYTKLYENNPLFNFDKTVYDNKDLSLPMPYTKYNNIIIKEINIDESLIIGSRVYKKMDIDESNNYTISVINVNIDNLNIITNDNSDISIIFEDDLILYNDEELECGSLYDIDNIFKIYKFRSITVVKLIINKYISKVLKYSLDDKLYIIDKINDEYILMEKLPIFEIFIDGVDGLHTYELHKILHNRRLINSYNSCTFKPYCDTINDFNMWKGIKANKNNINELSKDTEKIINFIKEIWCNDNINYFNYIISWLKKVICEGIKTKKCIVLYSNKQQVGKGIIINWIIEYVIGKIHAKQITGIDSLVCRFNQDLMNKILINVDELSSIEKFGYSAAYDVIKNKITEPNINIEIKGGRKFSYPDYSNYIFTTNHTNSIKIEENDKRYVVFNVSDKYFNNHEFFKSLKLNQETANEFYYYLSNFDNEVDILKNINNELRDDMIDISLTSTQLFLKYLKNNDDEDNKIIIDKMYIIYQEQHALIKPKSLFKIYESWCEERREKNTQKFTTFNSECKNTLSVTRVDNIRYFNIV